ncbi:hypothetical protein LOK49_LG01G03494 [Camellia lanceoleosa]|uniref:Uncharacterized protein n=1 Tax=Camellia lanceoleosa TaxID=1840588 RepID=A0ACC0J2P7_9ERIC|nr:hypothetical protein LOK49_LG01G03494 [Camellia lanceoleosa]
MRIAREDVIEATCPQDLVNTTLDDTLFEYVSSGYRNLSFLYGCPASVGQMRSIIKSGNKLSREGLRLDGRWIAEYAWTVPGPRDGVDIILLPNKALATAPTRLTCRIPAPRLPEPD